MAAVLLDIMKEMREEQETPEILTAESLRHLNRMTSSQLAIIYKRGKRKVKIADDPEAYAVLEGMLSSQLEAIFGNGED